MLMLSSEEEGAEGTRGKCQAARAKMTNGAASPAMLSSNARCKTLACVAATGTTGYSALSLYTPTSSRLHLRLAYMERCEIQNSESEAIVSV